MNDTIYNNNNQRQISMIPYLQPNRGITFTEFTKYGAVTKNGEVSKGQAYKATLAKQAFDKQRSSCLYNMAEFMNSDDISVY